MISPTLRPFCPRATQQEPRHAPTELIGAVEPARGQVRDVARGADRRSSDPVAADAQNTSPITCSARVRSGQAEQERETVSNRARSRPMVAWSSRRARYRSERSAQLRLRELQVALSQSKTWCTLGGRSVKAASICPRRPRPGCADLGAPSRESCRRRTSTTILRRPRTPYIPARPGEARVPSIRSLRPTGPSNAGWWPS